MREILFRGKTKNGQWVYGCYYKQKQFYGEKVESDCIIVTDDILSNDLGLDYEEVISETIGQFTGLTDKHGTKIFEGDIVKENDIFHNGELQIKGNAWQVVFADGLFFGNYKDISVYLQSLDGMEVIGNIHDNPELLEQK